MKAPPALSGVLLTLAYDGRTFSGWAAQANARTIAGELQGAIHAIDPRATALRGTSRTDAGVHARAQLASFDSAAQISPRGWVLALSQNLPQEIAVVSAATVGAGFDPRRCVRAKSYRYVVLESRVRDPFLEGRAWRICERLNQIDMQSAANHLIGTHDFAAFRGAADTRENTVRQLFRVDVVRARTDERILEIFVEGDRFLYRMVRIIAGTLVDVGRGRLPPDATRKALESRARTDLGITAPPDGLFLESIELTEGVIDAWPRLTECRA